VDAAATERPELDGVRATRREMAVEDGVPPVSVPLRSRWMSSARWTRPLTQFVFEEMLALVPDVP